MNQAGQLNKHTKANAAARAPGNSLLDISYTQASQTSTKKKKAKRQITPLPENQTIKHYFKPVSHVTAAEANPSDAGVSSSSALQRPSFSPVLTNLNFESNGFTSMNAATLYSLTHPAPLANYKKNDSKWTKHICTLKHRVYSEENPKTGRVFEDFTDVGPVDDLIRLIEFKAKYYLIQTSIISQEIVYQCILDHFGRFGNLVLRSPVSLQQCLLLEYTENDANTIALELHTKRDFLAEHFQTDLMMENNTVWMKSLPLIVSNYAPTLDKIPLFIYRISTKVNWASEKECIESLVREYALLYSCTTQHQWNTLRNQAMANFKAPKYLTSEGFFSEFDIPLIMRDDI